MVGLTSIDTLQLGIASYAILVGVVGAYCGLYAFQPVYGKHVVALNHLILTWWFWGEAIAHDTLLLFRSCDYLSRFAWGAFLTEFSHRDYVKLHPPFVTFVFSRIPSLPFQQCVLTCLVILTIYRLLDVFGARVYVIVGSPLFLLMSTQPSNDMYFFMVVAAACCFIKEGRRHTAALLYGASIGIKLIGFPALPLMAYKLRRAVVISVAMWAGYLAFTSSHYFFGKQQVRFLAMVSSTHETLFGYSYYQTPTSAEGAVRQEKTYVQALCGSVLWRWGRVLRRSLITLPFYLFPVMFVGRRWFYGLLGLLLFMHGNPKYLLVSYLGCLFDVDTKK